MSTVITTFVFLMHLLGILSAVTAVMTARTPQGSIAWAISLITFPYVAVPLYWIFGRSRFHGYVEVLRSRRLENSERIAGITAAIEKFRAVAPTDRAAESEVLQRLTIHPFTRGNALKLLVDGPAAFGAIFDAIEQAKTYVLVQFFIIHDDELGIALQKLLIRKATSGVRVHLLYDEIGSFHTPAEYFDAMRNAGIEVTEFHTRQGRRNRFQINFRNHRKIVVVDGRVAYLGGHNVGDEYMGRSQRFGHWRDTHVEIRGPAVQCVQTSFAADWYWARRELPEMDWACWAADDDQSVLILPTGPADIQENCTLYFLQMINAAHRRLWIASPYFVPDGGIFESLKLAALRGVDVRILLPEKRDHWSTWLAAFSRLPECERAGIKMYWYTDGFLHQKVVLVDDGLASVGTANLDNRSTRLNFEVTAIALSHAFAASVAAMLEKDLTHARPAGASDLFDRGFHFRLAVAVARLFSPIS